MIYTSFKKGVETPVHFKTLSRMLIPGSFVNNSCDTFVGCSFSSSAFQLRNDR